MTSPFIDVPEVPDLDRRYWDEIGHKSNCPVFGDEEMIEKCECGPRPQIKVYINPTWTHDSYEEMVDQPEGWENWSDFQKDAWAEEYLNDFIADRGFVDPSEDKGEEGDG